MSVDQLQPKPTPGPFTGPVNVNELNRILRGLDSRIEELRLSAVSATAAVGQSGYWDASASVAGTGDYTFDTQAGLTDTGAYGLQASSTQVLIQEPGTYLVLTTLLATSDSGTGGIDIALQANGVDLVASSQTITPGVIGVGTLWALVRASQARTTYVSAQLVTGDTRRRHSQLGIVRVA